MHITSNSSANCSNCLLYTSLSSLAGLLAARGVSLFAVSTYNTDYLFVRRAQYPAALSALREGGYPVEEPARYEEEEAPICPQP